MALVAPAPAPPPPPGAHPFPSSCSTSRSPLPIPGAPTTQPPPSPAPEGSPFVTAGRSKDQRWRDASPSSECFSDDGSPSYKDVLLSSGVLSAHAAPSAAAAPRALAPSAAAASSARPRAPTRIVLRPRDRHVRPAGVIILDRDGWVTSENRRARRERRRRRLLPRRPISEDRRGRCSNCLSTAHKAANCQSRPRCFVCRGLGHLSGAYPSRPLDACRQLVWRPKVSVMTRSPAMQSPVATGGGSEHKRKRRRRPRRTRPAMGAANADDDTGEEDVPSHPSSGPNAEVALSGAAGAPVIPRRVLHRSDHLSRNEDALRCALVITLLGGIRGRRVRVHSCHDRP